jgi:hypothetical protein
MDMNDLTILTREAIRRAILTLAALPDPDQRYLRYVTPNISVVRDAAEAYGWTPARLRFFPTPFDCSVYLQVLGWLSWYERSITQGTHAVRIVMAWATGCEYWRLSKRFSCSERTLRRKIDGVADTIGSRFEPEIYKLLLDGCHECPPKCHPSLDEWNSVSDLLTSPEYWIANGPKPCGDLTNPAIIKDRNRTIRKIERGNAKRRRRVAVV